jgi:hypothetical protein
MAISINPFLILNFWCSRVRFMKTKKVLGSSCSWRHRPYIFSQATLIFEKKLTTILIP